MLRVAHSLKLMATNRTAASRLGLQLGMQLRRNLHSEFTPARTGALACAYGG